MNPIFWTLLSLFAHPKRVCPQCKRLQIVPVSKKQEIVQCKSCGADIPPPPQ